MKRFVAIVVFVLGTTLTPSVALAATNPGTGQPSQSCQTVEASGGTTPGSMSPQGGAATSPGSPFNEAGINSTTDGKGGQAYTAGNSRSPNTRAIAQYDVACFQVSGR
jgi:hypothetical protein